MHFYMALLTTKLLRCGDLGEDIEEAAAAMDAHLGPGLFNKKGI